MLPEQQEQHVWEQTTASAATTTATATTAVELRGCCPVNVMERSREVRDLEWPGRLAGARSGWSWGGRYQDLDGIVPNSRYSTINIVTRTMTCLAPYLDLLPPACLILTYLVDLLVQAFPAVAAAGENERGNINSLSVVNGAYHTLLFVARYWYCIHTGVSWRVGVDYSGSIICVI